VSSLGHDEMITAINLPGLPNGTGTAFTEFARRHDDYASGGAAAVIRVDDSGTCTRARLTVLGGGSTGLRCHAAENALVGNLVDESIVADAAQTAAADLRPMPNLHGDSGFRRMSSGRWYPAQCTGK
jgi:6-hydroxypseudooxynicotine dehydrogenase subunit alpha